MIKKTLALVGLLASSLSVYAAPVTYSMSGVLDGYLTSFGPAYGSLAGYEGAGIDISVTIDDGLFDLSIDVEGIGFYAASEGEYSVGNDIVEPDLAAGTIDLLVFEAWWDLPDGHDFDVSVGFIFDQSFLSSEASIPSFAMSDVVSTLILLEDAAWEFNPTTDDWEVVVDHGAAFGQVDTLSVSSVPVPAAAWLFCSALIGLVGIKRK